MLRSIFVLWLLNMCTACPFAGLSDQMPAGHPLTRRLQQTDPVANPGFALRSDISSFGALSKVAPWNLLAVQPTDNWQRLVNKSAELGDADLCYWAFQTLPGPLMNQTTPSVSDSDVEAWSYNTSGEAPTLGDMAVRRMKALVKPNGPIVWAGCSYGRTLRQAACRNNLDVSNTTGARFVDCNTTAVSNATILVPAAINIFKIKSSSNATWNFLLDWRTNVSGHVPQMTSDLVQKLSWGSGTGRGAILSKLSYCSAIPSRFMYPSSGGGDCEEMGQTKLLADEALDTWLGLCNLLTNNCTDPSKAGPNSTNSSTSNKNNTGQISLSSLSFDVSFIAFLLVLVKPMNAL